MVSCPSWIFLNRHAMSESLQKFFRACSHGMPSQASNLLPFCLLKKLTQKILSNLLHLRRVCAILIRRWGKSPKLMWGISTVGRISLPYFIPKTVKVGQAVNGEFAQNLPRKFGALAQLVARNVRIVEVRGSNPLRSTTSLPVFDIKLVGFFYP